MDQFIDRKQIQYYDSTRPRYTEELFNEILTHVKENTSYLDIACGSGQLLFPLSKHFEWSVGIDASNEQIKKANENLQKLNLDYNKVFLYNCDAYQVHEKLINDNIIRQETQIFDLITVGQAFHWFDEVKLLTYLKNLLKPNGVLVLTGYKKQHFDELKQPDVFNFFQKAIETLLPFFECDVDNIDNAYYKSYESIKEVFGIEKKLEIKNFKEESQVEFKNIIDLLKSWSAYVNFKKANVLSLPDPIEELKKDLIKFFNLSNLEELESFNVTYLNFYFTVVIKT